MNIDDNQYGALGRELGRAIVPVGLEAGFNLLLCLVYARWKLDGGATGSPRWRDLLARFCARKEQFAGVGEALAASDASLAQFGENFAPYGCPLCEQWHLTRVPDGGAQAVRDLQRDGRSSDMPPRPSGRGKELQTGPEAYDFFANLEGRLPHEFIWAFGTELPELSSFSGGTLSGILALLEHGAAEITRGEAAAGINDYSGSRRESMSRLFEELVLLRAQELDPSALLNDTPPAFSQLMVGVAVCQGASVLDLASGMGGSLMQAARVARGEDIVGYELLPWAAVLAEMRLELAGVSARVECADTLEVEAHRREDGGRNQPNGFGSVIAHPPADKRLPGLTAAEISSIVQLRESSNGEISAYYVWLQAALNSLGPGGRAAVLLPEASVNSGGDADVSFRSQMLKSGNVEALLYVSGPGRDSASSVVWVLRKDSNPALPLLYVDVNRFLESRRFSENVQVAAVGEFGDLDLGELAFGDVVAATQLVRSFRSTCDTTDPDEIVAEGPRGVITGSSPETDFEGVAIMSADALIEVIDGPVSAERSPNSMATRMPTESARRLAGLTHLRLSNLKSFGSEQTAELAPITLIYGPNSSGKSSLMQGLLLLQQSLTKTVLVTQGASTDVGSFAGAVHAHDTSREIGIGISLAQEGLETDAGNGVCLDFVFSAGARGEPRNSRTVVTFDSNGESPTSIMMDRALRQVRGLSDEHFRLDLENADLLYSLMRRRDSEAGPRASDYAGDLEAAWEQLKGEGAFPMWVPTAGLLPSRDAGVVGVWGSAYQSERASSLPYAGRFQMDSQALLSHASQPLANILGSLSHLGPMRDPLSQRLHERGGDYPRFGAVPPEFLAAFLFDNSSLVADVNEWFARLGVPYKMTIMRVSSSSSAAADQGDPRAELQLPDHFAISLVDARSGVAVTPADVGFGVSQVLPIVVALLAHRSLVTLIEQPEIHIHPRLQAELGDLFIRAAVTGARPSQIIVETHSETLILRLQRRIREGDIEASDVSVLYVDQGPTGEALVRRLRINGDGNFVDRWPQGFFVEQTDEILGVKDDR